MSIAAFYYTLVELALSAGNALRTSVRFALKNLPDLPLDSVEEYIIMHQVRAFGMRTKTLLAEDLSLPISTVSSIVGRLKDRELLDHETYFYDRRDLNLLITAKGLDVVQRADDVVEPIIVAFFGEHDVKELQRIAKVIYDFNYYDVLDVVPRMPKRHRRLRREQLYISSDLWPRKDRMTP
jgi:DNA-binding MarR family transcriptional regulator